MDLPNALEQSYLLVKPGVEQLGGLTDAIGCIQEQGLQVTEVDRVCLCEQQVRDLYPWRFEGEAEFAEEILTYLCGRECVVIIASGEDCINKIRRIKGKVWESGLRLVYADNFIHNAYHCPDSPEEFAKEVSILLGY